MTIKTIYLTISELEELEKEIKYIGSENLKKELNESINFLKSIFQEGEYIINILTPAKIRELETLKKIIKLNQ